ncbi:hypothetical protein [uncultured Cohaesibacter sp.]|uniref:hypothetical protein n=1 Tax=uncultured Cohaesibacter sp. TaxID=1002546 RepID=UPI0029C7D061|nr:hypothetical protein [uncultured Cohaesibacter sp.]
MKNSRLASTLIGTISLSFISLPPLLADPVEVTICAHPEGQETQFRSVDIRVIQDGFPVKLNPAPLQSMNHCYLLSLPDCRAEILIHAASSSYYKGSSPCRNEPQPIKIAMSPQHWQIAANALSLENGNTKFATLSGFPRFDAKRFQKIIEKTNEVIAKLPADARIAEEQLFAALAEGDFSKAQNYANDLSEHFRKANEEGLSLAYSSITYIAGFRAIGIDALAPEKPLLTTAGTGVSSFVIMNNEGQDLLKEYQALREVRGKNGVWDYATTNAIAEIGSKVPSITETKAYEAKALPEDWRLLESRIDSTGRMTFEQR